MSEKSGGNKSDSIRAGASSENSSLTGSEVKPDEDMQDLFLTEENLVRLAIGHLGGRRPPPSPHTLRQRDPGRYDKLVQRSQPARLRRALAGKLRQELESRSWTALELSERTQLSIPDCRALLAGEGSFTPEVAKKLGVALATSENFWLVAD